MRLCILLLLISTSVFGQKEVSGENTFTEGMKLFLLENYSGAFAQFESFVKIDDKSAVGYFMKSRTEAALGKLLNAEFSARKSVELDKTKVYYLQNLADILTKSNKNAEAQQAYKDLIALKPSLEDSYFLLVTLQLDAGQKNEAIKTLEKAEKNLGSLDRILEKKQSVLLENNKVSDALKEGNKLIAQNPEALISQAKSLKENNKTKEAIVLLEGSLSKNASLGNVSVLLSELYVQEKKYNELETLVSKVLDSEELETSDKSKVVLNLLNAKKPNEVLVNKILEKISINESPYVIGTILEQKGDFLKAKEAFVKAVGSDKNLFEAWVKISEINYWLADFKSLEKDAERATMFFPNQGNLWFYLGLGQFLNNNLSDLEISKEELERVKGDKVQLEVLESLLKKTESELFKKYPNLLWVQYFYIRKIVETEPEKAMQLAKNLASDKSIINQLLYIKTLVANQKNAEANELLNSINPEYSSEFWELKGDVNLNLGKKEEAIKFWNKALVLDKNNKKLQVKLRS